MIPNSIILLCLCFIILMIVFKELSLSHPDLGWGNRDCFIFAVITFGFFIFVLIEGLSILHLLERTALIISWMIISLIGFCCFVWLRISRTGWNRAIFNFKDWEIQNLILTPEKSIFIILILFQLVTLMMVAYVYPPNNWDSMTYHMSRVVHWQQNKSVEPYATNIGRQTQSQPFAEYQITNLQILLKKDQFANFVQYFAFLVCFIGITNITKKLGGNSTLQLLAGMVCVSIPMAILQSTSTQNDLVVSQYLVCFISTGILMLQTPKKWILGIVLGISLGIAGLTKATAWVFALPFCVWFGIDLVKSQRKNIVIGLIIGLLALGINGRFLFGNYSVYGNPLGSQVMFNTSNTTHSLQALASNAIRYTALNISVNEIGISRYATGWLYLLHHFTGMSETDSTTSFTAWNVFSGVGQDMLKKEDYTASPLHAILILMTTIIMLYMPKTWRNLDKQFIYGGCLVLSFLSFCFFFKFQDWGNRLTLPLLILWSPIIILFGSKVNARILGYLIIILLFFSYSWTFENETRPINMQLSGTQNREILYFSVRPDLYTIYSQFADQIITKGCANIGLNTYEDTWEYPFWILLKNRGWQGRLEHVNVKNESAKLQDPNFEPCAVIADNFGVINSYPGFSVTQNNNFVLLEK